MGADVYYPYFKNALLNFIHYSKLSTTDFPVLHELVQNVSRHVGRNRETYAILPPEGDRI